ncbi:MAG: ABC transporter substrate-binding protein [Clostridiales bacterium]|nr:ABC transporter substrate-binding protein [Clostridiales bacterium]
MNKRLFACLGILTLLLLFTGCNKKKSVETGPVQDNAKETEENVVSLIAEGNYTEFEVLQPEMESEESWLGTRVNSENQIEIYTDKYTKDGGGNVSCYTYIDGNYQKTSEDWIDQACKELDMRVYELCQSEDGNQYMLCMRFIYVNGQRKWTCVLIKKSNNTEGYENVTPSYWYDEDSENQYSYGPLISQVKITKNQILCFKENGMRELHFFDLNKKESLDYGHCSTLADYTVKENTLYYIDETKKVIQIQDLEGGTSEEILYENFDQSVLSHALLQVMPNDDLVLLNSNGLHIKRKNGTVWEVIVDGTQNSMSTSNYQIRSLCVVLGEYYTFYVSYSNTLEDLGDLYVKYEPSSTQEGVLEKELTICSLHKSETVSLAIDQYRRKHKDVNVKYNVVMPHIYDCYGQYDSLLGDTIRSLNTEILAGKGPDIILMDELPLSSYIEKGVLMDISDLFSKTGQKSILLKNVEDCYRKDDKVYCMPLRILMPIYGGHEEVLSHTKTVEDLAAYCDEIDTNLINSCSYEQLVTLFLSFYSNEIFSSNGQINKDGLTSFLSSLYRISNQIGASYNQAGPWFTSYNESSPEAVSRLSLMLMNIESHLMWENYCSLITISLSHRFEITYKLPVLSLANASYQPINRTFVPNGLVGINQSTKDPELAKDFVNFLFDESIQNIDAMDGFPVNENSLNSWIRPGVKKSGRGYYTSENGESVPFEYEQVTTEDMRKVIDAVKTLDRPMYDDVDGKKIIIELAVEYLKGDKTLDQVADEITQKYNLYLSE